jgi:hypothetical protein
VLGFPFAFPLCWWRPLLCPWLIPLEVILIPCVPAVVPAFRWALPPFSFDKQEGSVFSGFVLIGFVRSFCSRFFDNFFIDFSLFKFECDLIVEGFCRCSLLMVLFVLAD